MKRKDKHPNIRKVLTISHSLGNGIDHNIIEQVLKDSHGNVDQAISVLSNMTETWNSTENVINDGIMYIISRLQKNVDQDICKEVIISNNLDIDKSYEDIKAIYGNYDDQSTDNYAHKKMMPHNNNASTDKIQASSESILKTIEDGDFLSSSMSYRRDKMDTRERNISQVLPTNNHTSNDDLSHSPTCIGNDIDQYMSMVYNTIFDDICMSDNDTSSESIDDESLPIVMDSNDDYSIENGKMTTTTDSHIEEVKISTKKKTTKKTNKNNTIKQNNDNRGVVVNNGHVCNDEWRDMIDLRTPQQVAFEYIREKFDRYLYSDDLIHELLLQYGYDIVQVEYVLCQLDIQDINMKDQGKLSNNRSFADALKCPENTGNNRGNRNISKLDTQRYLLSQIKINNTTSNDSSDVHVSCIYNTKGKQSARGTNSKNNSNSGSISSNSVRHDPSLLRVTSNHHNSLNCTTTNNSTTGVMLSKVKSDTSLNTMKLTTNHSSSSSHTSIKNNKNNGMRGNNSNGLISHSYSADMYDNTSNNDYSGNSNSDNSDSNGNDWQVVARKELKNMMKAYQQASQAALTGVRTGRASIGYTLADVVATHGYEAKCRFQYAEYMNAIDIFYHNNPHIKLDLQSVDLDSNQKYSFVYSGTTNSSSSSSSRPSSHHIYTTLSNSNSTTVTDKRRLHNAIIIDFHGLNVRQAIAILRSIVTYYDNIRTRNKNGNANTLGIIVGVGNHSHMNKARLKPNIIRFLNHHHYDNVPDDGIVWVTI